MNIKRGMFTKEYLWRTIVTLCGLFVIVLTLGIGGFLVYKGSGTFLKFNHSIGEFLFSPDWAPIDNMEGGGSVGTLIFIVGSLSTWWSCTAYCNTICTWFGYIYDRDFA